MPVLDMVKVQMCGAGGHASTCRCLFKVSPGEKYDVNYATDVCKRLSHSQIVESHKRREFMTQMSAMRRH